MNRNKLMIVAVLLAVTMVVGPAVAQPAAPSKAPLADKLPAQSVIYLGWGGVGPNKAALDKTGVGQLINDPEIRPHVDAMWSQLEVFLKAQGEKNLPPGCFDAIRSLVVDTVIGRPWAFSFVDIKLPKPDDAGPPENPAKSLSVVLLVDLGDKPEAAVKNIDTLLANMLPKEIQEAIKPVEVNGVSMKVLITEKDAPEILWGATKNHLVVTIGRAAAEKVIDLLNGKAAASLASNPQFAKVLAKTGGGIGCLYLDVARLRKDFLPLALDKVTHGGDKESAEATKIIAALGGDAVDAFGCAVRADGDDFVQQSYVLAPRGKPGLLVLADQKPVSAELLSVVPADSTFAILLNMNRAKVLAEFEKQIANFPDVKAEFDKTRKDVKDATGLDLKDLSAAVGDGVAIYNSPSAGGFLYSGLTIVAEIKDVATIRAALPKLEATILKQLHSASEEIAPMLRGFGAPRGGRDGGETPVAFKQGKFKDYEYRYTVTSGLPMPFAPAWCLTDKYLVFSLFPQSLKAALLKIEAGKDDSLLANDWLAKQLTGTAKGASAISYVNQKQLTRIAYPLLLPLWQVGCSMAGKVGISLDVNAMPRQDMLLKYSNDSIGAMIPDADGVTCVGRGSSPLSIIGVAPVLPAVLLPSLGAAMEQGKRTQSAANLRGLANCLRIYANNNNDKYPDSLDQLVKDKIAAPEMLKSPSDKGHGPSYIYLKPANPNHPNSTRVIVAYERLEDYNNDGTNVLFLDGHVKYCTMREFKELMKEQPGQPAAALLDSKVRL